jgi:hypothetical protein
MVKALSEHWPEYLMEAAELGMFMVSACTFATILVLGIRHHRSPRCFPTP